MVEYTRLELRSAFAKRLYERLPEKALTPIVDEQGFLLLSSFAEEIPLSEPKLDVKKPEESS
jgi:hypothetical protein